MQEISHIIFFTPILFYFVKNWDPQKIYFCGKNIYAGFLLQVEKPSAGISAPSVVALSTARKKNLHFQ